IGTGSGDAGLRGRHQPHRRQRLADAGASGAVGRPRAIRGLHRGINGRRPARAGCRGATMTGTHVRTRAALIASAAVALSIASRMPLGAQYEGERATPIPAPAPVLEILAPTSDAYISGSTTFRAAVTPPAAASRVLFSV